MSRLSSLSIRSHLVCMAMIVAIPALVIIVYSGMKFRQNVIDNGIANALNLSHNIAAEQNNLTASARQLVSALAQLPEVRNHNVAKTRSILEDILKLNPQYSNIFVADKSGKVWGSAIPKKTPFEISDRRYFKNAITTGRFSSGEYILSRATGKPVFNFAYPFKGNGGEILGVICVGLSLDFLRHNLDKAQYPAGTSYVIIDHKGLILSRGIDQESYLGKQDNPDLFKLMQGDNEEGVTIGVGIDGQKRIITYHKLHLDGESSPYIYVRAGTPVSSVVARAYKELMSNLTMISLSMLLAAFLAWLVGKRSIVDRIARLQAASWRLANGELQVRVSDYVKGGELGELAQDFDEMARQLAWREQQRCKAEEKYRLIVNTANEGIWVLDENFNFTFVNDRMADMLGFRSDEMIGKSFDRFLIDDDLPDHVIKVCNRRQGMNETYERRIRTKNGTYVWVQVSATPMMNEENCFQGCFAMCIDITRRKMVEEQLQALNAALDQRVRERTAELEHANRELESFCYSISHELRAPIARQEGFSRIITECIRDAAYEELAHYAERIDYASQRLRTVVDRLLSMTRLSRANIVSEKVDLSEISSQIANELLAGAVNRKISISIGQGIIAHGDKSMLNICLHNLLGNAFKFTAMKSEAEIEFGVREESGKRMYFVRDTGAGFDMAFASKLFLPFSRLHNEKEFDGIGLGLATTKRIVERHGGQIWAEASVDEGATFFFTISGPLG